MNRKFNSRQWWEFLIVDQAARQHQPTSPLYQLLMMAQLEVMVMEKCLLKYVGHHQPWPGYSVEQIHSSQLLILSLFRFLLETSARRRPSRPVL